MSNFRKLIFTLLLLSALFSCAPGPVISQDPADLRTAMRPNLKIQIPGGPGPFPTVIIFHGANEPVWRDGYGDWMNWLVSKGYAVAFIDSAATHGVSADALMGPTLMPNERAVDVYIALDILRQKPFVDSSRFALLGMSHGGDTVLDALVQLPPAGPLKGLTKVPPKKLDGVRSTIAFYPGCRAPKFGVRITENYDRPWTIKIPVHIFQGSDDTYVNVPLCQYVVERQKMLGMPISYHFYKNSPHCFDANYGEGRDCYYDANAAKHARKKVQAALREAFGK